MIMKTSKMQLDSFSFLICNSHCIIYNSHCTSCWHAWLVYLNDLWMVPLTLRRSYAIARMIVVTRFKGNKCITETCLVINNIINNKYFISMENNIRINKFKFTNILISIVNTSIYQTLLDQITGHLMILLESLGCWAT